MWIYLFFSRTINDLGSWLVPKLTDWKNAKNSQNWLWASLPGWDERVPRIPGISGISKYFLGLKCAEVLFNYSLKACWNSDFWASGRTKISKISGVLPQAPVREGLRRPQTLQLLLSLTLVVRITSSTFLGLKNAIHLSLSGQQDHL